jgi:1-acyl-sn-glycerol-3-phosphate acyltransferase
MTVLPGWTKTYLLGDESVVTALLTLFCVGMAFGSLLCERMSRRSLELGLVPLGSIGISLFALDLFLAGAPYADPPAVLHGLGGFWSAPSSARIAIDLLMIAVFSGFYTVPLYTMIQQRSPEEVRSRVIAGNNILNALFMVASSILLGAMLSFGFGTRDVFLVIALLNAAVAAYIYTVIPEFLLRFAAWMLANVLYRLKVVGRENIPRQGPAVLVANHVSFVDWLLIAAACPRPVRFVMYHRYFQIPLLRFLFRDAKVIPIAPAKEDEDKMQHAFDRIAAELADHEIVCIFPEGRLTDDGSLGEFRPGIERILARSPVSVIPVGIIGMWGSFFSKKDGAMQRPFRRFWSRVTLVIGRPLTASQPTREMIEAQVASILAPAR